MQTAQLLRKGACYFSTISKTDPIAQSQVIQRTSERIICDFQKLQIANCNIDSAMILNGKLNHEWLLKGLKAAENVVLVDGGANQFYNTPFRNWQNVRSIVGDLDSLDPKVQAFYLDRGVQVKQIWNQDANDFEKAVKRCVSMGWENILCFGAFGERMDHSLSAMHHAEKLCKQHKNLSMVLFGKNNLMYYMRPNVHHQVRISHRINKMCCGLIPFGKAEYVQTKGFRWNLGLQYPRHTLEWGEFISTSNQIEHDTVEIFSTHGMFAVFHFTDSETIHRF